MKRYHPKNKPVEPPAKRRRPPGGNYFPPEDYRFIPSGCTLLDCVLGGGWVLGRVENIIGDTSSGKTLLAISATSSFAREYPKGKMYYREAESAFDLPYATRIGLPVDKVDFGPQGINSRWKTIEAVFEDLRTISARHAAKNIPGLYVLDSLDALSSEQALARKVNESSYNLEKQRILAQLFEQLVSEFKAAQLCIMIISQTRDRIGKFIIGDKQRRSGGNSLDFYSSHLLWLRHLKMLTKTIRGEKRATGILVQANCKKNKVTNPHGRCVFPIRFGFGIDDVEASIDWLVDRGMHDRLGIKKNAVDDYYAETSALSPEDYKTREAEIRAVVIEAWQEVEGWFAPPRSRYE